MAEQPHKVHLLSPYLEGELTQGQQKTVESHLRACAYCRQELSLLRQAVDALEEVPLEKTSADFLAKLKRRLDQATPAWHVKEPYTQRQIPTAHRAPVSARQALGALHAPSWLKPLVPWGGDHGRLLCCPSPLTLSLAVLVAGLVFTLFFLWLPRELVSARPEQASPGISAQMMPPSTAIPPPVPWSQTLTDDPRTGTLSMGDGPPGVEPSTVSSPVSQKEETGETGSDTHLAYDRE